MKGNTKIILYRILLITFVTLFVMAFALNIVTVFNQDLFGNYTTLIDFVGLILAVLFASLFLVTYRYWVEQRKLVIELRKENQYTLGHDIVFYNLNAFKSLMSNRNKKRIASDKKKYILAFTATASRMSTNYVSNDNVMNLNYLLSKFLNESFNNKKKNKFNRRNMIYGFNRGTFLIYAFLEKEEDINEIITIISNETYRIVNEERLKIWAQPFFGVREYNLGENITSAIEDAFVARNIAEANFESFHMVRKDNTEKNINVHQEILDALKNDEFSPYYQPKYSLKEKKFISSEVLARWNSPTRGIVPPGLFIEQAEQAGILPEIDLIMFEKGLNELSEAIKRGRRVISMSFNFSLYEFFSHNFLETITGLITKYNVPTNYIEIEITETTSQINQFLSISVIKKLKKMGIRVLMDDYGVGYSQIDNFNKIPFDGIKIDKSFTDNLLSDDKSKSIVRFLTELGHENNMEVIIEGVETKAQVDVLRRMHIDTIQGYYYSKPLNSQDYYLYVHPPRHVLQRRDGGEDVHGERRGGRGIYAAHVARGKQWQQWRSEAEGIAAGQGRVWR